MRSVIAAAIGNALEWYDFTIYALFAIYIARAAFPDQDPTAGLIKAFVAFGVGFVARPVGAVAAGFYADRVGRKTALNVSLMIMAAGTMLLAFVPDYRAIGIGAPLLMLAARLLQGLSAGAETGAAVVFLIEQAPPGRAGWYGSWLQTSTALSSILSGGVAFALTSIFTLQDLNAWAWRLPFFFGLIILPVAMWLRSELNETPVFIARNDLARTSIGHQLRTLFTSQRPALRLAFSVSALWVAGVYVILIYMPIHAQHALGFAASASFASSFIAAIVLAIACPCFGALGDRVGCRRILSGGALGLLLLTLPLMIWLRQHPDIGVLIAVQAMLCAAVAMFSATAPAFLVALFPVDLRATGMAVSYNAAAILFGGFAPAILTALSSATGGVGPALYVTAVAIFALIMMRRLPAVPGPVAC